MMEISKLATTVDHLHMNEQGVPIPKEVLLAEDLILEILFRVPPISILRFTSICKKWYSLISNPDFLEKFHQHPQRLLDHDILLISTVEEDKEHTPPPPEYVLLPTQTHTQNQQQLKLLLDHAISVFIPQKLSSSSSSSSPRRLIDCCNGLLLYRNGNNPISDTVAATCDETTQYHVVNPITKQCFQLPMIESFGNNFGALYVGWIHIVFDPSVSLSFKVLICFARRHIDYFGIYVYSSETSSWNCVMEPSILVWFSLFDIRCHCVAVLLDGMLYVYTHNDKLVCFDVVEDRIWFLPLPLRDMKHHKRILLYFGKCNGRLRLIEKHCCDRCYDCHHEIVTSPFSFDIMELEDVPDGQDHPEIRNWTVKYRVDIEMNYEDLIPLAARIIHICETGGAGKKKKKGEEDEALLFLNVGRKTFISYNLTSNTFGKERKISDLDHSHGLHAFPYTPTLFTLP